MCIMQALHCFLEFREFKITYQATLYAYMAMPDSQRYAERFILTKYEFDNIVFKFENRLFPIVWVYY